METQIKSAPQLSLLCPGRICALNCDPNRQQFTVIYTGDLYTENPPVTNPVTLATVDKTGRPHTVVVSAYSLVVRD